MFRQHSLIRATGGAATGSSHKDQCFLPCCDYRKLNLVAFAGSLLYIGYIVGYSQSSQLGTFPFGAGAEQTAYSSPPALRTSTASPGVEGVEGGSAASDAVMDGKNDKKSFMSSAEDMAVGQGAVDYSRDKPATSIVRRLNPRWNSESS